MPEFISYVALVTIICAVLAKILTANSIGVLKRGLAQLEAKRAGISQQLQSVVEQHASAANLLEFYEGRKVEVDRRITEESVELELLTEAERKYLAGLGYDSTEIEEALERGILPEITDESQAVEAAGEEAVGQAQVADPVSPADGEEQAEEDSEEMGDPVGTLQSPDAAIEAGAPVAVIPVTLRDPDKLFLPDALVSELLGRGANVVDRFAFNQQVEEAGEDLENVLASEHYFRLGTATDLRALIIVNSLMLGSGVGSATCRVVDLPSGKILLSTSYEQPGETERSPDFESLTTTAQVVAQAIGHVFGATPESTEDDTT